MDNTSDCRSEYKFFSNVHGMFSKIHHMLGQNISLNKFKKIEIISSIFSDHNAMKLEINHKKKTEKTNKEMEAKHVIKQ